MNIANFFGGSKPNSILTTPVTTSAPLSNNAPSAIEIGNEVRDIISQFLASHPVIDTEVDAKRAMELETQGLRAMQEMDDERLAQTRPLKTKAQEIEATYRISYDPLKTTRATLTERLDAYQRAEKAKREAIAAEAARQAQEKIRLAEEAARREREALENAAQGEIGVQVGDAAAETATAVAEANKAIRAAQVAEKDTAVKIGLGFGKSRGLRIQEVLTVTDPVAAVQALGLTEGLDTAIKTAARAYRTMRGSLPPGVTSNRT